MDGIPLPDDIFGPPAALMEADGAAAAGGGAAAQAGGAAAAHAGGAAEDEDDDDDDGLFVDAEDGSGDDEDEDEEDDEGEGSSGGEDDGGGAGSSDGEGDPAASWVVVDPVEDAGLGKHGCEHYRRRCRLVAPCCGEVFWCRHCHNAAKDDGEQDLSARHALDRKQVSEVECALCSLRQPVAEACRGCGVRFGRYSCLKCNFFDDNTSKKQFHCEDCGICRVGGRDNFFHCSTCNCCYSLALQESHVCVQNSMHQNCPVCFEYLFDSVRPITVLLCGHTIHQ
ncbi:hypothetical protein Rsub_09491, partial [Raphidocelis subcapitata]